MRPQLYTADAIALLTAQPPARPGARSDKSASGFDSLLKEARSAREASRRKADRSEPTSTKEAASDDPPVSDESGASTDQGAAPSQTEARNTDGPASTTPPSAASEQPSESKQQKPTGSGDAEATVRTTTPALQAIATDVGKAAAAASEEKSPTNPGQVATEGSKAENGPVLPATAAVVPVPQDEAPAAQVVGTAATTEAAGKQEDAGAVGGPQATAETSAKDESCSPRLEEVLASPQPQTQKESPKPASKSGSAKDDARPRIGREYVRQLRVDAARQDRSADLTDVKTGDAKPDETAASRSGDSRSVVDRSRSPGQTTEAIEPAKAVGFQVLNGDNTAASIARFLISAPAESSGSATAAYVAAPAAGHSQSSSPSTAAAAPVGQAAGGASTNLTTGVLSPGLDAAGSLDATARVLSTSGGEGRFHVTMQLDPPELGQLRLQIHMESHAVTMRVDADTPASARLIESRLSDLRDALAAHGISLDRNDVVIRSPASSHTAPQNQEGGQNSAGQHGRGEAESSGGWLTDGGQTPGSQEQAFSGQGMADEYGQAVDAGAGAAAADDNRVTVELMPTTELSLDLVA